MAVQKLNLKPERTKMIQMPELPTPLDTSWAKRFRELVIGHDDAVQTITDAMMVWQAGLSEPGKPIASFLLGGVTGSGKTHTAESLAEAFVKNRRALIRIDCAEFQHSHEIAKLIGSPPGYLGHRETNPVLCQDKLNQHFTEEWRVSFLLFDEIEKANDALWNLMLGILDKGTLTLGDNRKVDFSRSVIFFTSNIGAVQTQRLLQGRSYNFLAAAATGSKEITKSTERAARGKFSPEFLNRLDAILTYEPLTPDDSKRITHNLLQEFADQAAQQSIDLTLDKNLIDCLMKTGYSKEYGMREMKRTIQRELRRPLAYNLLNNNGSRKIHIYADRGKVKFNVG